MNFPQLICGEVRGTLYAKRPSLPSPSRNCGWRSTGNACFDAARPVPIAPRADTLALQGFPTTLPASIWRLAVPDFQPFVPAGENRPEFTLRALLLGSFFGLIFGAVT